MKIIKAIKQKITDHHHGCCSCGGTPTAKAAPAVEPLQRETAKQKKTS